MTPVKYFLEQLIAHRSQMRYQKETETYKNVICKVCGATIQPLREKKTFQRILKSCSSRELVTLHLM